MAAYVELYMNQGCSFLNVINLTDDVTNDYINIAGYSIKSETRRSYYSSNASGNLECSMSNVSTGEIRISMTPANTANMIVGRHFFDVKVTDTANNVSRPLEGVITVMPRVTR